MLVKYFISFSEITGVKSVHLVKISEIPGAESSYMDPEVFDKEVLISIFLICNFKLQNL